MDFKLNEKYKHWHYKNTIILVASFFVLYFLLKHDSSRQIIFQIENLGLVGVFFAGIFYVSTFTIAPASVVLYNLANQHSIWEIALVAGLGGVVGDYLIFRFFKDQVFEALEPAVLKLFHRPMHIFKSPYFLWLMPVVGAIIMASPLPDELAVGLLGISKLKNWQFLLLAFVLDTAGIFVLISVFKSIQAIG